MSTALNGSLVPVGGGDTIPLLRPSMTMGRRESCDICLRFPNVSGMHGELTFQGGCWHIRDLGSTNGLKVNDVKVTEKVLLPGDTITIAKRSFTIAYTPHISKPALMELQQSSRGPLDQPLMEKAGLEKPANAKTKLKKP